MIIFLIIVFILPCSKANNFVNDLNIDSYINSFKPIIKDKKLFKSKNPLGFEYKKVNFIKIKLIIIKNYIHLDLILVEIIKLKNDFKD